MCSFLFDLNKAAIFVLHGLYVDTTSKSQVRLNANPTKYYTGHKILRHGPYFDPRASLNRFSDRRFDAPALWHCNKSQVQKNQHNTITTTICKTEHRENKSRFCHYDGNKMNIATKLRS